MADTGGSDHNHDKSNILNSSKTKSEMITL